MNCSVNILRTYKFIQNVRYIIFFETCTSVAKSADRYCLQNIFIPGKIHLSQYILKLLSTESTCGIISFSASKKICIKIGKDTFKSRISPCSNQAELNEIKINDNHEIFEVPEQNNNLRRRIHLVKII